MWSLVGAILLSASNVLLNEGAIALSDQTPIAALPFSLIAYNAEPILATETSGFANGAKISQKALQNTAEITAEQAVQDLLASLRKAGYSETTQGIWIQNSNGVLLASRQATRPLPAASLTKIATTLAALSTWEPNHRFVTTVGTTGKIVGTTLQGDLTIYSDGDPFFVWEEAIVLGNTLSQMGITRIQGNLVLSGRFYMNFETEPKLVGSLLRQSFNASSWSEDVIAQYERLPFSTPKPRIAIAGNIRYSPTLPTNVVPLIRHNSLPLWQILKRMNIYSNNEMAEILAASMGGASAVIDKAAKAANVSSSEIRLINGSGLGQQNRISPHAVTAMLIALHNLARSYNFSIADLLLASDCRCGTTEGRNLPSGSIVKTGTLSNVSALAGMLQTRDQGPIWFAIVNQGEGDLGIFHEAQDRVLRSLRQKWGKPSAALSRSFLPIPFQDTYNRNQIVWKP